jgi:biotin carboxyl carrier protein
MKYEIELATAAGKTKHIVELRQKDGQREVTLDGRAIEGDAVQVSPNTISVMLGGRSFEINLTRSLDGTIKMQCGSHEFSAHVVDPRAWRGRKQGAIEVEGRQEILAPMPGKIVRVLVAVGESVEAGQGLLVVEAMKMQNEIRSPKNGKVERLLAKEGQAVNAGEVLAWVD